MSAAVESVGASDEDRRIARFGSRGRIGDGAGKLIDSWKRPSFIAPGLRETPIHSFEEPGRDRAFDHVSAHDDEGNSHFAELSAPGAQRLLACILAVSDGGTTSPQRVSPRQVAT